MDHNAIAKVESSDIDVEMHATTDPTLDSKKNENEGIPVRLRVRNVNVVYGSIHYKYVHVDIIVAWPDTIKSLQPP